MRQDGAAVRAVRTLPVRRWTQRTAHSSAEVGQPAESPNTRHEEVLATSTRNKAWHVLEATSDGTPRNGEGAGTIVGAGDRVLLVVQSNKVTVVHPDAFGKLELPGQAGAEKAEHHTAISPVVFERALRQH